MGHRALLAYRRETDDDSLDSDDDHADAEDDSADADPVPEVGSTDEEGYDARYDLHRSHWGGADFALLGSLSDEEPFASDTHVAVDPEPVATDLSLDEIVTNYLDFLHHEAFYRVGLDYETTAYHVLWFGLEADCEAVERSETVGHGALIEAHPDDADYLRGWFRGTKSVVTEMVNRGAFAPDEPTTASEESTTASENAATAPEESADADTDEPSDDASAEPSDDASEEPPERAPEEAPERVPEEGAGMTADGATNYLAERAETWAADREVILPD